MGTGVGEMLAYSIFSAIAGNIISESMRDKPKLPKAPEPVSMPDPEAQQDAMRKKILEQVGRGGRASTIMTSQVGGKLGS